MALAYLLFDRGLLTEADTGGLALRWGDPAPCFALLDQIAACQGFGALLAQGSRALAAHYGDPDLAVQINGLDVAMHDPRAFSGQALVVPDLAARRLSQPVAISSTLRWAARWTRSASP